MQITIIPFSNSKQIFARGQTVDINRISINKTAQIHTAGNVAQQHTAGTTAGCRLDGQPCSTVRLYYPAIKTA